MQDRRAVGNSVLNYGDGGALPTLYKRGRAVQVVAEDVATGLSSARMDVHAMRVEEKAESRRKSGKGHRNGGGQSEQPKQRRRRTSGVTAKPEPWW